jgi:hypothetical protein
VLETRPNCTPVNRAVVAHFSTMQGHTMKLDKKTMLPIAVTAVVTIVVIAAINNVDALESVKKQLNGDKGWF